MVFRSLPRDSPVSNFCRMASASASGRTVRALRLMSEFFKRPSGRRMRRNHNVEGIAHVRDYGDLMRKVFAGTSGCVVALVVGLPPVLMGPSSPGIDPTDASILHALDPAPTTLARDSKNLFVYQPNPAAGHELSSEDPSKTAMSPGYTIASSPHAVWCIAIRAFDPCSVFYPSARFRRAPRRPGQWIRSKNRGGDYRSPRLFG